MDNTELRDLEEASNFDGSAFQVIEEDLDNSPIILPTHLR